MNNSPDEIIKFFEGGELTVYPDTAGLPTVGVGHLVRPKDNLKIGDTITPEQAEAFFQSDLNNATKRVDKVISSYLLDYQKSCLISQAFNLRSFEQLAVQLEISGKDTYKRKMLLYCKDSKGTTFNGLFIRRIAERLLFENRYWLDIAKNLQTVNKLEYTQQIIPKLFPI